MSGYSDGRRVGRYGVEGFDREDYFWRHVEKGEGCWLWTGYRTPKGYGHFGVGARKAMLAHRYSYELHIGPLGSQWALHHCDNPSCVNPDHLYAGDVRDNVRDMLERGRHATQRGEEASNAKLTDEQVRAIRRRFEPGVNRWIRGNSAELAAEFGVAQNYIRAIVAGKWRATA